MREFTSTISRKIFSSHSYSNQPNNFFALIRYKCNFCEKTFSDKGACNSHEKVHTKSEHSNCEVCGKHFARKQKLKYHMR